MRPPRGKRKLLDAAMTLFESQGYFSTTIEDITAQAGVSKGLVYNYFRSKEELLVALLEDATARMKSAASALEGGANRTPEESLLRFLDAYFELLKRERGFLKLQLTLMLTPELRDIVEQPQQERAQMLLGQVRRWFQQAGASQPMKKARLLLATLDGLALHYLSIFPNYPLTSMKSEVIRLSRELYAPS